MKIHLIALVPLGALAYFILSSEGYVPRFRGDFVVWIAAFAASVIYQTKIHKRIREKLNKRREERISN